MYNSRFVLFLIFIGGQELVNEPLSNLERISKWSYDDFSYADFGTQEQHSYFSVLYELNPKLHAELQGFYDTHRTADVFDLSTRIKWYPTKKVYLFTGIGFQMVRQKGFGSIPTMPVRTFNGVGYEPNKNISIEAVHNLNFNKNRSGLNATPSLLTFKGKYRF